MPILRAMNQCPFCGKELGPDDVGCRSCGEKLAAVLAQVDELSDGGRFVPVLDFKEDRVVGFIGREREEISTIPQREKGG